MRLIPAMRVLRTAPVKRETVKRETVKVAPALLTLLLAAACGAGSGDQPYGPGNVPEAGVGGASGGSGGGTDFPDDETCVGQLFPGDVLPLVVYILLDATSSMKTSSEDGAPPVWDSVVNAIVNIVSDPMTKGISVGLTYLPVDIPPGTNVTGYCKPQGGPDCPPGTGSCASPVPMSGPMMGYVCDQACVTDEDCGYWGPCVQFSMAPQKHYCEAAWDLSYSCDPHDYGQPAVPIAELPGNKDAIRLAVLAKNANGGSTPSGPALEGTHWYARDWALAHPDHLVNVLFATDGAPNLCTNKSVEQIAQVAYSAANTYPYIPTFVLGIGKLASLNAIAIGGGTEQAYIADGETVSEQLVSVFNDIRASGACQFLIPQPDSENGLNLDFNKVNVQYTPLGESEPTVVGYVNDIDACDPVKGGWYYDDSTKTNPTRVLLCPATCAGVKLSENGVDIRLGCWSRIY